MWKGWLVELCEKDFNRLTLKNLGISADICNCHSVYCIQKFKKKSIVQVFHYVEYTCWFWGMCVRSFIAHWYKYLTLQKSHLHPCFCFIPHILIWTTQDVVSWKKSDEWRNVSSILTLHKWKNLHICHHLIFQATFPLSAVFTSYLAVAVVFVTSDGVRNWDHLQFLYLLLF